MVFNRVHTKQHTEPPKPESVMSKKHEQRTRAEILAKRAQPIIETNRNSMGFLVHTTRKPERSIYMPHFGAKQRAKLAAKLPTTEKLAA
jgi:hypothetical protein